MRNKIHTFDQCVSCQRQHQAQVHACAGCGFELPRADLAALHDSALRELSGLCLAVVNDNKHPHGTRENTEAAGLLVLADRELRNRAQAAWDKRHGTLEPRLYAVATRP